MTQPFSVQANGQTSGSGVAGVDSVGNEFVNGNLTIGTSTPLGDNAAGALKIANIPTVPTTNPVGGSVIYVVNGTPYTRDLNGTVSPLVAGAQSAAAPAGVIAQTMHRYTASASASPSSGTLYIQEIFLAAGTTVSKIGFVTSTTAATNPTHWWTALLDQNRVQQAHAADQTTTAIPASTGQLLSMATPYTATYTGPFYLALMIATSTTQPTVVCSTTVPIAALISGTSVPTPVPGGTSTGSLTTPGTDGSTTYANPTTASNFYYMWCQ